MGACCACICCGGCALIWPPEWLAGRECCDEEAGMVRPKPPASWKPPPPPPPKVDCAGAGRADWGRAAVLPTPLSNGLGAFDTPNVSWKRTAAVMPRGGIATKRRQPCAGEASHRRLHAGRHVPVCAAPCPPLCGRCVHRWPAALKHLAV